MPLKGHFLCNLTPNWTAVCPLSRLCYCMQETVYVMLGQTGPRDSMWQPNITTTTINMSRRSSNTIRQQSLITCAQRRSTTHSSHWFGNSHALHWFTLGRNFNIITFRRRREMYIGRVRLSVYLSVGRRIPTLLHGPGCKLGEWSGCLLVVHHWVDLQSVHEFRC